MMIIWYDDPRKNKSNLSYRLNAITIKLPTEFVTELEQKIFTICVETQKTLNSPSNLEKEKQGLSCGPVVKTPYLHCRGMGLIPGLGTRIPHAMQCRPKKKKGLLKQLQVYRCNRERSTASSLQEQFLSSAPSGPTLRTLLHLQVS